MKVQISLADELVERADSYADENYMSRSGLFSIALTQYLNQNDFMKSFKDLVVICEEASKKGHFSEDDKKSLDEFKVIAKLLIEG